MRAGFAFGAALVLLALGCGGPRLDRAPWREGTELVLLERASRTEGVAERRTRWRLAEVRDGNARFERTRDDVPASAPGNEWLQLAAGVPRGRLGIGARGRRHGDGVVRWRVRVPAGAFRCSRTVRSVEQSDGAMMRVDEWWAPGVPVPVQAWSRWEGVADSLPAPPRVAGELPVGTTWTVLESIRRP